MKSRKHNPKVRIIHTLQGRLRVEVSWLKHHKELVPVVEYQFRRLNGIRDCRADQRTGRLLLIYEPAQINEQLLIGKVRRFDPFRLQTGWGIRPFPQENKLHWQAIRAALSGSLLGAVGLRRLSGGKFASRDGLTLDALAAVTTILSGYPVLSRGLRKAGKQGLFNPDVVLGASGLLLALLRNSVPGLLASTLVNLNELLYLAKLKEAYREAQSLLPPLNGMITVLRAEKEYQIPALQINKGDEVLCKAGEYLAVDGAVLSGAGIVNEQWLTGEAQSQLKKAGLKTWAGSRLESGWLKIKTEAVGDDTALGRLRAELQLHSTEFLPQVPRGIFRRLNKLALLLGTINFCLTGNWQGSIAILLAATPAAAPLAGVIPWQEATNALLKQGIVVTDPWQLLQAARVNTVVFDKTGTITDSCSSLSSIHALNGQSERELLQIAAALEDGNRHPLARGMLAAVGKHQLKPWVAPEVREFPGRGLTGIVKGNSVLLGSPSWLEGEGIDMETGRQQLRKLEYKRETPIVLAVDGQLAAVFGFTASVRQEVPMVLGRLRAMGLRDLGLVSGETGITSRLLARKLGLKHLGMGLTPLAKQTLVYRLREQGRVVALVGDGINDIPALSEANLGVAVAENGFWAANAGIILPKDVSSLPQVFVEARRAVRKGRQNLTLVQGLNYLGLGLAAGGVLGLAGALLWQNMITASILLRKTVKPRKMKIIRPLPEKHGATGHPVELPAFYTVSAQDILEKLQTRVQGLAIAEAEARFRIYGFNRLEVRRKKGFLLLFACQFRELMVEALGLAAMVSFLLGQRKDALAILAMILLNAVMGALQEHRAEKLLNGMQELTAPVARVKRDGRLLTIPAEQLVPGDVLLIAAGDVVAADSRVITSQGLAVNESLLTGETVPVAKSVATLAAPLPLAEQYNMIFSGTGITRGRGEAVVVATGFNTEAGKIALLLNKAEHRATPLEEEMASLARYLLGGSILIAGVVSVTGLLWGRPPLEMLLNGISLAVAAVPEGLPATVTIAMAAGVHRMARNKVVVRRLPAVETLGCAEVILTDKTGTLTSNQMTVTEIVSLDSCWEVEGRGYAPSGEIKAKDPSVQERSQGVLELILKIGAVCNNSTLEYGAGWRVIGDPTEGALLVAARKKGIEREKLLAEYPFREEIPFDEDTKKMTVICRSHTVDCLVFMKGAPEQVLADCTQVLTSDGVIRFDEQVRQNLLEENERLAKKGLRVLALAYRVSATLEENPIGGMIAAGLVGMYDPPRAGVKEAIKLCEQAGIKVVMVTGDQQGTALAVAGEVGLLHDGDLILGAAELDKLGDNELQQLLPQVAVFSRLTPRQKLRVVQGWKARQKAVVMTGDGVNDAPAVKEADVGMAMGRNGTQVTREVADVVLTDDDFTTIISAVEQGRAVYDNIRRSMEYTLKTNVAEVLVMLAAVIANLPTPLTPLQLLYINLVGGTGPRT